VSTATARRTRSAGRWLIALLIVFCFSPVEIHSRTTEPDGIIFTDPLPGAPELARRGPYGAGVQTLELIDRDQIDLRRIIRDPEAVYDRTLTVEVWYPARIPPGVEELTAYTDPTIAPGVTFYNRALRDAPPDSDRGPYPMVIVSHGLGGSRLQLAYLGDHLASWGFVVAAIDHADGAVGLPSVQAATLYRPLDIQHTLDELARLGAAESESALAGMIDAASTGLIGYSYGGYGVLVTAGAGIRADIAAISLLAPGGAASIHQAGSTTRDERIRAVFTFAPFGMDLSVLGLPLSYWDADGLSQVDVPLFIMVGDADTVAHYETGSLPIFEQAVNSDRYLLTLYGAEHDIAPNLPPHDDGADWKSARWNNIAQHFVTAFMGRHLQPQAGYADLDTFTTEEMDLRFAPAGR
jgi:predicted dienelactone hydrolase